MTTLTPQDVERQHFRAFVTRHADERYRKLMQEFYPLWSDWNLQFFAGQMLEPHLEFGRTAHRSLGHCEATTDYGGRVQITLNEGLVFGTNPDWVIHPWPAEGMRRFLQDLLLRYTVRQNVLEVHQAAEAGYRGFGPLFTHEANRIGLMLGLPAVVVRRRGTEDADEPVCTGWPHCVRPTGYYGDDITAALLDLATGGRQAQRRLPAPPTLGLLELLLYLLRDNKNERLEKILIQHIDRLQEHRSRKRLSRWRVEEGQLDVDGSPLGEVAFDVQWLGWNNGTVRKVAEAVHELRAFGDLPILADALEEAGCMDERILRHLRANIEHTRRCWVLQGLLKVDRPGGQEGPG